MVLQLHSLVRLVHVLDSSRLFRLAQTIFRSKPSELRRVNRVNGVHLGRNQNIETQQNPISKSTPDTSTGATTDTATGAKIRTAINAQFTTTRVAATRTTENRSRLYPSKFRMHSSSWLLESTREIAGNTIRMLNVPTLNPMHGFRKLIKQPLFYSFILGTCQANPHFHAKTLNYTGVKCKGLVRGYPSQV
jgi:hypothetical protein